MRYRWVLRTGILSNVYRRRLALEWWAAMAVAVFAVVGTVLGLSPWPLDGMWLLGGFGATFLVAAVMLVLAFWRPASLPPVPSQLRDRDVAGAEPRVRRGEPVDPPELQAAAIDQARRGLRIAHLTVGLWPVLGASWALRIGEGGFFGGFGYVGLVVMLLGVVGLTWSGRTQRRLDHLEDSAIALPTTSTDARTSPAEGGVDRA